MHLKRYLMKSRAHGVYFLATLVHEGLVRDYITTGQSLLVWLHKVTSISK